MRLITFTESGTTRIGILDGESVVDLSAASPDLPREMVAFLEAGDSAMDAARSALEAGGPRLALADIHLESPILRPPKILAVGLNYADHVAEAGMDTPKYPMIFNKQSTSAHPPNEPFHLPRASPALDYEGELAVVIGKRCRHVPQERAYEVVAGYTICNDVSVRDWQIRVPTFTMGKSWDTHCPLGPAIVSADEVPDPHSLDLRTWVNGELRQSSNTKHLIFKVPALIEHLSTAFTLEPGDVIPTGTPSGVGAVMKPPKFLQAGDVVKIAISGIGELENGVIEEPENTVRIG
ncbi:MAG: fumarylacetoacetate hydrolase family protein [Myxococcota bacterium]|nr:fumarylacetoacetate hydrolase family protein [Myxococcota bacterium]